MKKNLMNITSLLNSIIDIEVYRSDKLEAGVKYIMEQNKQMINLFPEFVKDM